MSSLHRLSRLSRAALLALASITACATSAIADRLPQTITFPAIADPTDGDAPLVLNATSSSGLPVYYKIISGFVSWNDDEDGIAEPSDGWLRLDYPGPVTLLALVDGDDTYAGAEPVQRTFTIRTGPRPVNDDFARAATLPGDSGTLSATNRLATTEPEEPENINEGSPNRTLWWRWTAPANGYVRFDGDGSDLDALVYLYRGANLSSMNEIGSWRDDGYNEESAVVRVTAGTVYYIRMNGYGSRSGDLRLNWDFLAVPVTRPAARITSQGGLLSWQGNASTYRIEIYEPSQLAEWRSIPRFTLTLGDITSHVLRGLAPDTAYAVRIVAKGDKGFEARSEELRFTTLSESAPSPANDSASSAELLAPAGGRITGSNQGATNEAFETNTPLASVWYHWTPSASGLWRLRLSAPFATTLALYPADAPASERVLANAQNAAALDWEARADTAYLIQVSGQDAGQGTFGLSWELVTPGGAPSNDAFADAIPFPATTGATTSVTGSNRLASVETGEPDDGAGSVWWRWTATSDGIVKFSKTSDFDSRLFVYAGSTLNSLAPRFSENAYYQSAPIFSVESGVTYYFRVDGTHPASHGTVQLTLTFHPRPVLAPATAITETSFTLNWSGTDDRPTRIELQSEPHYLSPTQSIKLPAGQSHTFTSLRPGTTYSYTVTRLGSPPDDSAPGTATTLPATSPVPVNDAFDSPALLTPEGGNLVANNRYASREKYEYNDNAAEYGSLWYEWTPPTSGEWRFRLSAGDLSAGIAIYSAEYFYWSISSLSPVDHAFTSSSTGAAECLIAAKAGQTYRIALLGLGEAQGDLALAWDFVRPLDHPANDAFANATILEEATGSLPATLDLASVDDIYSAYGSTSDVWYLWRAPADGTVTFSLSATRSDTALEIHAGDSLHDLGYVAHDRDYEDSDGLLSCEWNAEAGVIYSIRIVGRSRLGPDSTLTWRQLQAMDLQAFLVTRGARFFTLRLPPPPSERWASTRLVVSTRADLSEPVLIIGTRMGEADLPVTGLRPSTRYYYQISYTSFGEPSASAPVGVVDTTADASPTPANDFSNPVPLPATGASVKGTTVNALLSPALDEEATFGPKVWYAFTPATSGLWKVRVAATAFNPRFELFQADILALVTASNDNPTTGQFDPPAKTVERLIPLRAGQRYLVAVGGSPGQQGTFTLSLALRSALGVPANESAAAASEISGRSGSVACDPRLARLAYESFSQSNQTLWWRWTAPSDERVLFTLAGDRVPNLYLGADNYNAYDSGNSVSVTFDAVSGQTYLIRAGSRSTPGGVLTLSWRPLVGNRLQSIDFPPLIAPAPGQSTIKLAASASSGLPVTYNVLSGPATVEGDILHLDGPGYVLVGAYQTGDDFYAPAEARQSNTDFAGLAPSHSLYFPWPGDRYVGSAPGLLYAESSSGLPVRFEIVSGPATVASNALSVTGPGKVVVRASQPGNATIPAAPSVEQTFTVLRAPTAPVSLGKTVRVYDGQPQPVLADTVPAGLQVAYTYKTGDGPATATPPINVGAYTVTATLDDPEATAPASATSTLVIAKATLVATGPDLSRAVGSPNPPLVGIVYSGFIGADTAADLDREPVATTKASAKSAPGVYPINLSGGSDNNYEFIYAPGTLRLSGFGGTYEALLFDADAVALGKLELVIPANSLAFTGTLTLAGELLPVPVRGVLASADGRSATGAWERTTAGADQLGLSFRLAGDTFDGALLRNGEAFLSIPSRGGARLQTSAKLPGAGAHTLLLRDLLPLDPEDARPLPPGGHASAVISPSGTLSLKGKLADGLPLTSSAKLDVAGRYRLLLKPYAKRLDSFLSGQLALTPHPDQTRFPGRLHVAEGAAVLVWAKSSLPDTTPPSVRDQALRAGFSCDVIALLDPWLPPAAKPAGTLAQRLGLADSPAAAGEFAVAYGPEGLDLGARTHDLPTRLGLSIKNAVTTPLNATRFSIKITPATGAFAGSFVLSDQRDALPAKPVERTVAFTGTLRQAPADEESVLVGAGFFLVPGFATSDEQASGELRFTAP